MGPLPAKPDGSVIEEREEFEGTRLSWPLPSVASVRYVALPFFALWTIPWAIGLIASVRSLIVSPDLGLLLWIVAWTICGGWAPVVAWASFRRRPESVVLGHDSLTYDRGWALDSPTTLDALMSNAPTALPRRPIVLPRRSGFFLAPAGDRHRLGVEHEGEPIEIGASLGEPDRAWLHGVLERWRRV
jgi:hypothetical protein